MYRKNTGDYELRTSIQINPETEMTQIVQSRHKSTRHYCVILSESPAKATAPTGWRRIIGSHRSRPQHFCYRVDGQVYGTQDICRGYYTFPLTEEPFDCPDVDDPISDHARLYRPGSQPSAYRVDTLEEPSWTESSVLSVDYFLRLRNNSKRTLDNRRVYESRIQELRVHC